MKDDLWTIRKMREAQKHSTTRNTYKRPEDVAYVQDKGQEQSTSKETLFNKIGTYFMLILEEG